MKSDVGVKGNPDISCTLHRKTRNILHLSVCLSVCLSGSVCLSLSPSPSLSRSLSLSINAYTYIYIYIILYVSHSHYVYMHKYIIKYVFCMGLHMHTAIHTCGSKTRRIIKL